MKDSQPTLTLGAWSQWVVGCFVVMSKVWLKVIDRRGKKEENRETRESSNQRGRSDIVPAHRYSMYAVRDTH
jgi:hypothetical protein